MWKAINSGLVHHVQPAAARQGTVTAPVLQAFGLSRSFGTQAAVQEVSLALAPGVLHAVLGPAGAGKTTLANLLSGEATPDSGTLQLDGETVTGWPAWKLARAGIGRSYQRATPMPAMTAQENVRLAAQARLTPATRLWRSAAKQAAPQVAARAALERVGLGAEAGRKAVGLDAAQQRRLALAMALAAAPRVLLLDEPLAGLEAEAAQAMATLLRDLARDHAVLLLERDTPLALDLADQVSVMLGGRLLATGRPASIRASTALRLACPGLAA